MINRAPILPTKPFLEGKSHWLQLVILLLLCLAGMLVFSAVSLVAGLGIFGQDVIQQPTAGFYRFSQLFTAVGSFLLPAILFSFCHDRKWFTYNSADTAVKSWKFMLYVLLLAVLLLPITGIVVYFNQQIQLPDSLKAVSEWMRVTEEANNHVLEVLTADHSWHTLLLNILVCAVLPALCEEFFFRGTLQQLFCRWMGNAHVAIWVTAIIFSAIHFQFSGFFARMLLGAYLGYLFYWSRSLWLPIFAHLLHNSLSLMLQFAMEGQNVASTEELPLNQQLPMVLVSIALAVPLLIAVYRKRTVKDGIVSSHE